MHFGGHGRTRPGAAGENDVGDPNMIGQIREGGDFVVLIGEREIGNMAGEGQRLVMAAIEVNKQQHEREAYEAEKKNETDGAGQAD